MSSSSLSPNTVLFFDGLRFFLASIVVIGHGFGFFFNYWNGFFPNKIPYIQSIAVVGFFFVSGFLITSSVLIRIKKNSASFLVYAIDRFARIYCTLIPCMLFVAIVDYAAYKIYPGYEFSENLTPSIFFKNILLIPSMPFGSIRPIWSLMFEWWIYVLFGGIVFFIKNKFIGLLAVIFGAYYTFFVNGKGEAGQIAVIWMFGAISAYFYKDICAKFFNKKLYSSLFFVFATLIYLTTLNAYNLFAGCFFSIGLLLLAAHKSTQDISHHKNLIVYRFLAGYSFTLFLTHYTVLSWIWRVGFRGIEGFMLSIAAANIISIFIARYTEGYHKHLSRWMLISFTIKSTAE
jgi:peptidoglycan/LPS O-acetylase OafA/YrhL